MTDKFKTTYSSGSFSDGSVLTAGAMNLDHEGIDFDIEAISLVLGDIYGNSISGGGIAYVSKMIRALGPVGILTPPILDHPNLSDYYDGTSGAESHSLPAGSPVFELFTDFPTSSISSLTVSSVAQSAVASLDALVAGTYHVDPQNARHITFYDNISGTTVEITYTPVILGNVPKSSGFNTIPSLPDFINNSISCTISGSGPYTITLPTLASGYNIQLVDLRAGSYVSPVNDFINTTAQVEYAWPSFITDDPVANYQTGGYGGTLPAASVLLYRRIGSGSIQRIEFSDEPVWTFNTGPNTISFATTDVIADTDVLVVPAQGSSIAQLLNYYMNFAEQHDHSSGGGTVIDHSSLTGLTDPSYGYSSSAVTKKNVHPQYLHRAGFDKNDISSNGNNNGNAFTGELRLGPAENYDYADGTKTTNMPAGLALNEGAISSVDNAGDIKLVILGTTGEIISDSNNYFESNSLVQTEGRVQFRTIPSTSTYGVVNINNTNTGIMDVITPSSTTEIGLARIKTALNLRSPNSGSGEGVGLTFGNGSESEPVKIYSFRRSNGDDSLNVNVGNSISMRVMRDGATAPITHVRKLGFITGTGTNDAAADFDSVKAYAGIKIGESADGYPTSLRLKTNLNVETDVVGDIAAGSAYIDLSDLSGSARIRLAGKYKTNTIFQNMIDVRVNDTNRVILLGGNGASSADTFPSDVRIGSSNTGSTAIYSITTTITGQNVNLGNVSLGATVINSPATYIKGFLNINNGGTLNDVTLTGQLKITESTTVVSPHNISLSSQFGITLSNQESKVDNSTAIGSGSCKITFSSADGSNIYGIIKFGNFLITQYVPLVAYTESTHSRLSISFKKKGSAWAVAFHRSNNINAGSEVLTVKFLKIA